MAATPEQKRLAAEVAAEMQAEGTWPDRSLRVVTGRSAAPDDDGAPLISSWGIGSPPPRA